MPSGSTPSWSKNRRSSIAIVAFGIHGLIRESGTTWRFCSAGIEPSNEPSAA